MSCVFHSTAMASFETGISASMDNLAEDLESLCFVNNTVAPAGYQFESVSGCNFSKLVIHRSISDCESDSDTDDEDGEEDPT